MAGEVTRFSGTAFQVGADQSFLIEGPSTRRCDVIVSYLSCSLLYIAQWMARVKSHVILVQIPQEQSPALFGLRTPLTPDFTIFRVHHHHHHHFFSVNPRHLLRPKVENEWEKIISMNKGGCRVGCHVMGNKNAYTD